MLATRSLPVHNARVSNLSSDKRLILGSGAVLSSVS